MSGTTGRGSPQRRSERLLDADRSGWGSAGSGEVHVVGILEDAVQDVQVLRVVLLHAAAEDVGPKKVGLKGKITDFQEVLLAQSPKWSQCTPTQ